MKKFKLFLRALAKAKDGATAVEYGLMIALIAAVIAGTVAVVGDRVDAAFDAVDDEMSAAGVPAAPD